MADETTPVETSKKKRNWTIAGLVFLFLLVAVFSYMVYNYHQDLTAVKNILEKKAEEYNEKQAVFTSLTDIANDILTDRGQRKIAKDYAKNQNITFAEAVATMAYKYFQTMYGN